MVQSRLAEQERYTFHFPVTVENKDVSSGGHLGADNVVLLFSSARASIFHSMGLAQEDLGDGRTGIIIVDMTTSYRAEAFLGDELVIDTRFGAFTKRGFRVWQRMRKDERVVALGETGILTFDYRVRKVVPVPGWFLDALAAYSKP